MIRKNKIETPKEFKIKRALERRCDRCPPHRIENLEHMPRKSWKFRTKKEKSYL